MWTLVRAAGALGVVLGCTAAAGCAPLVHVRSAELARPGQVRLSGASSVTNEDVYARSYRPVTGETTSHRGSLGFDLLELTAGAGIFDRLELSAFGGMSRQGAELRIALFEEWRGDPFSLAIGIAGGHAFRWTPRTIAFGRDGSGSAAFGRLALDWSVRMGPWLLLMVNYALGIEPWTSANVVYVSGDELRALAGVGVGVAPTQSDGSGVRLVFGFSAEAALLALGPRTLGIFCCTGVQQPTPVAATPGIALTFSLGVEGIIGTR